MRCTLSQPFERDDECRSTDNPTLSAINHDHRLRTHGTSRMATLCRSAVALVLFAVTTACSNETRDHESANEESSSSIGAGGPVESSAEAFHWPNGANHPVMRLEIQIGDRRGTIDIELIPELAPASVRRIGELATGGHYDATTFHRVIPNFMIQGGDPNSRDHDPSNDGRGGTESDLPDEFSAAPFARGVVALANRGHRNSNSRQFFIMLSDHPELNGRYTVVGRVLSGIEVVDEIARTATDKAGRWGAKDRPLDNIQIRRATIEPSPAGPQGIRPLPADPPTGSGSTGGSAPTMTN